MPFNVSAQRDWETYFDTMTSTDDAEALSWQSAYDLLNDLSQNKMNINTATRDDLGQLPFLNDEQIEAIHYYIYRYGAMKTEGELALIEQLDMRTRNLLACFVYFGDTAGNTFPSLKNILKYGQHRFIATAKIPLYERQGDKNGYIGYNYKHSIRYSFNYGERLKAGLTGAQDAGEPFFARGNSMGYDHYSFYLLLRKLGKMKTIAIGRYRISAGMGLVINTDFTLGKTASLANIGRNGIRIRAHSSRTAADYLQGTAATMSLGKAFEITGFVSYRNIDATLSSDGKAIATILTDGYHRTESEMMKKNNASNFIAGGNLCYNAKGLHLGFTGLFTSFDKELRPKTSQSFRRFYPSGNDFHNLSISYGYNSSVFSFKGETAVNDMRAVATVNSLQLNLSHSLSIMALQRFYGKKYYSLFSSAFSEGGRVQNESGMFLGANWRPSEHFSLMAYTDYAYFAWARYMVSRSSHTWDNLIQAEYAGSNFSFSARYKLKMRQQDNADKTSLVDFAEHRARLSAGYTNEKWSLQTQTDVAYTTKNEGSFGWMITERASCHISKAFLMNATAAFFKTESYDSRIYIYERGMQYDFSFPMFYGKGMRFSILANARINSNMTINAKIGTTKYFDRNHISSGLQQINHSSMTDIEVQLRLKI